MKTNRKVMLLTCFFAAWTKEPQSERVAPLVLGLYKYDCMSGADRWLSLPCQAR